MEWIDDLRKLNYTGVERKVNFPSNTKLFKFNLLVFTYEKVLDSSC